MILVWLFFGPLSMQANDTIRVSKTQDFTVNGKGDQSQWQTAAWIDIPARRNPDRNLETRFKTLYSDKGMYFLFHCVDEKLTATMDEDFEHLWEEDVVEVFLWTDQDHDIYFEYEISPLNYELPILVPNFDGEFLGWRPWDYEGDRKVIHETSVQGGPKESHAEIDSWTAEFFIPYVLLRPLQNVPPQSGTIWRANMYRVDHDNPDASNTWTWQRITKGFHDIEHFGVLVFE